MARAFRRLHRRRAGGWRNRPRPSLPQDLAEFLLSSWEGAILRMKVERTAEPLERFKRIAFATVFKEPSHEPGHQPAKAFRADSEMAYREAGSRDAPVALFLHGNPTSSYIPGLLRFARNDNSARRRATCARPHYT